MSPSMPSTPRRIPFLDTIGASRVSAKRPAAAAHNHKATITCTLSDHVRNYAGNMHGGVIAAVAESAARAALREAFSRGRHATVEMKLNYFRPILDTEVKGMITAVAQLLESDSRICVANVDVFDSGRKLAAAAIVTMQR